MTLRMTKVGTLVYVEGRENDPTYYQAIADQYASKTGRTVELRQASELPNAASPADGGAGGKRTLLRAAMFLHRWRANREMAVPPDRQIVFCVDKDVDDVISKTLACPGIIYTPLHSVENHLIRGSDIGRALAAALGASPGVIESRWGNAIDLGAMAALWKEWVVCCLLCLILEIKNVGNYKNPSPLNNPHHHPANPDRVAFFCQKMRNSSGLSQEDFDAKFQELTVLVDGLIAQGRYDEVFKGKWYVEIMFSSLKCCLELAAGCAKAGKNGLWIGIRAAFRLSPEDFAYYEERIQNSAS